MSERIHFQEEQRRNRRQSLRFSVFAVVAVALAGIPLCVLIAPLGLGLALVVVHLLDWLLPVSPVVWARLDQVVHALPAVWDRLLGRPVDMSFGLLAAVYVLPGAALMLLVWPLVLRLTRLAGAGTVLHRLPNRVLDRSNFAERQLENVVHEMAVAAGVKPPAVRIILSDSVNAVAVGLTTNDAVILATAGFLDRLDRDQRQAVVAHLVGSVGNGDLEIGAIIFSVFETWGLVTLLLETPIHRRARAQVRRFFRVALQQLRRPVAPVRARKALDPLLGGAAFDVEPMIEGIMAIRPRSVPHALFVMFLHLPVIAILGLASITARQAISLFTAIGLGPWLSAMWRARRRLADATAVQLTRHPAALAGAVQAFEANEVEVPGGWVANFLFPVWVPISDQSAARQTEAAAHIVGMRLEAAPRLKRLQALGARLESADTGPRPRWRERLKQALPDRKELTTAVLWGMVALLGVGILLAVTLAAASLLLMALWWGLGVLRPRA